MPLTEAQKRIYASAPHTEVVKQGLTLKHPAFTRTYHITNYPVTFQGLVDGILETFEVVPFVALEPRRDSAGQQDMRLAFDNNSPTFIDEIERAATAFEDPITVEYRVFIEGDPAPQNSPPIVLYLSDIEVTVTQIIGVASRADIVNAPFPRRYYTTAEFPGLAR